MSDTEFLPSGEVPNNPPDGRSYRPEPRSRPEPLNPPTERLSVTLAEIDEQRAKGWPDFHPEDFCHRCGGKNVRSWYVDSDRFNAALGRPDEHPYNGIVCPGCFVELHERATALQVTWKLIPDPQQAFRPRRTDYGG